MLTKKKTIASPELALRTKKIIKVLKSLYGELKCFLNYRNDFELICAVCLSAQCTDDRVNLTTPGLFKKYPTPEKMAKASQEDMEKIVKPCGFYKNKSRNLIAMARSIVDGFDGELPRSIEELITLAGVGRKTANVVLGTLYGNPAGVVVDTHVKRITNLLGISVEKEPEKIEQELNLIVPKADWDQFSLLMIAHGRETCIARRPKCSLCQLNKLCEYAA